MIRDRTTPTAFRGFPWWLPLITALIGALVALAVASSATASWVADARLWVRSDVSQSAGLSDALRDPQVLQTTLDLNGSDWTPDQLAAATRVVANEGLVTVTVTARSESEAEELATSLASAAIEQHRNRTRGAVFVEPLGLTWPGAQRSSPHTARNASLAAVAGLVAGIAVAAALSGRAPAVAPTTLALLGRRGWRPLALIPERQRESRSAPPSAAQLADAIAARLHDAPVTAFASLHSRADAGIPALQAARALAGRGVTTLWLDARVERPVLIALPRLDGFAPTPVQLADPGAAAVPPWLHGLLPPSWAEQLGSLIGANRLRFEAIVVVAGQLGDDERARDAVAACDRVVLAARDDFRRLRSGDRRRGGCAAEHWHADRRSGRHPYERTPRQRLQRCRRGGPGRGLRRPCISSYQSSCPTNSVTCRTGCWPSWPSRSTRSLVARTPNRRRVSCMVSCVARSLG